MCSTVRGPATSPYLVTCPIGSMWMEVDFASWRKKVTHSRTCGIPQGWEEEVRELMLMEGVHGLYAVD
eukprot:CAMPEP_0198270652 /NCGR_PEP_ID=MMETSP1447-20131203/45895_1 /TAXON_ID=420782 /ORGANISM="Chaetoceros dichaeta, Strain CCMP1751" /LENGTH=67 /DNA_ID=CAMNT_0043962783 /DNA_START=69 /DNA_END=269 /DNA_ORIENTATION=-